MVILSKKDEMRRIRFLRTC